MSPSSTSNKTAINPLKDDEVTKQKLSILLEALQQLGVEERKEVPEESISQLKYNEKGQVIYTTT